MMIRMSKMMIGVVGSWVMMVQGRGSESGTTTPCGTQGSCDGGDSGIGASGTNGRCRRCCQWW